MMLTWAFALSFLTSFLTLVAAWEPDYILRVSEGVIHSDCAPRHSVLINGTSPGPLLRFVEGEHYWVRVYNDMESNENTTIHWHGFTQFLSPFSDGTPQVSGWPIPPGHFYDYEFQLQEGHYGTYWYHSHVGFQLSTAQGPIIVDQKEWKTPVEYDEDLVVMIGEYWHADDHKMVQGILNNTQFQWIRDPQAVVINGRAANACNASALPEGEECSTECGSYQQKVKPNTKYRVRVINAGVLSYFSMALEGHKMTLFEADGTYLEPLEIESLEIGLGQRYSVLIETKAEPEKENYWWRYESRWRPTRVKGASVWTYADDAPTAGQPYCPGYYTTDPVPADLNTTVNIPDETFDWRVSDMAPWQEDEYPPTDEEVTRVIILDGVQLSTGPAKLGWRWSVNDVVDREDFYDVPYLVDLYGRPDGTRAFDYEAINANDGYDNVTNSYVAQKGEVLDIVIQNKAGESTGVAEAHPWHAHGNKYWDMAQGKDEFTYDKVHEYRANAQGKPFLRDTSVAYPGPGESYKEDKIEIFDHAGWRLFRIRVENPGAWLIHCHILPHAVMGMQALLMYAPEDLPPIPSSLYQEYSTFGGGATASQTYDPGYEPRSYFAEIKARAASAATIARRAVGSAKKRLARDH